jgi:P pilus assembly chaperone PapD
MTLYVLDSPGLSIENSPNVSDSQITDSKKKLSSKPVAVLSHIILPSNKHEPSIVFQNNTHSFTNKSNSTIHTLENRTQQYSSLMSSSLQTSTLLPSEDIPCELTPEYFLSSPVSSVS